MFCTRPQERTGSFFLRPLPCHSNVGLSCKRRKQAQRPKDAVRSAGVCQLQANVRMRHVCTRSHPRDAAGFTPASGIESAHRVRSGGSEQRALPARIRDQRDGVQPES